MPMVILEVVPLRAPSSLGVHEAALPAVTEIDGTTDGSIEVPRGRRFACPGQSLPRRARQRESPRLQPPPELPDRLADDRAEVAVRYLGTQKRPEPLEIVMKLLAGGELDLVAARRQRLDHRRCGGDRARSRDRIERPRAARRYFRIPFDAAVRNRRQGFS